MKRLSIFTFLGTCTALAMASCVEEFPEQDFEPAVNPNSTSPSQVLALAQNEEAGVHRQYVSTIDKQLSLPTIVSEVRDISARVPFKPSEDCGEIEHPDIALHWATHDKDATISFDIEHLNDENQSVEVFASISTENKPSKKYLLTSLENSSKKTKRVTVDISSITEESELANISIFTEIGKGSKKRGSSHNILTANIIKTEEGISIEPTDTAVKTSSDGIEKWHEVRSFGPEYVLPPEENKDKIPSSEKESVDSISGRDSISNGIRYCFRIGATYDDVGAGEDYWTSTGTQYREAEYVYTKVYFNGTYKVTIYLDGSGCTPYLNYGSGSYKYTLYSKGFRGQQTIQVRDTNDYYTTTSFTKSFSPSGIPETFYKDFSGNWTLFTVYLAAMSSLSTHSSQMGTATVDYTVNGNQSGHSNGKITMSTTSAFKKFKIAHETGHAFTHFAVSDGRVNDGDCSFGESGHELTSKEWMSCSIQEGFAAFYSADVWNSHSADANCFYSRDSGGDQRSCEFGSVEYPEAYLENEHSSPYTGYGTDIDWMRQFWDVHTNDENGQTADMDDVVDWLDTGTAWGQQDGYTKLNAAANTVGGAVNANWDHAKGFNGVDH